MYAGFDLGGTKLKYGLVDDDSNILFAGAVETPADITDLMTGIKSVWEQLKKISQTAIKGAGFGFPGIFSTREQKVIQSPNYPDVENFALLPALARIVAVPLEVDNDANMAAYGEYSFGAGKGAHSMILLTIGTGVGTGIVLEGNLWQGACGFGGELGHACVNPAGEKCKCGSRGCLETEVSAPKIVKNYLEHSPQKGAFSSEQVYSRALKGEPAAKQAFAQAGRALGIGISIAINFLNPEKVVLGGGVMKAGDLLRKPAIEEARLRSYPASFRCCEILAAQLGNQAGFMGAAGRIRDSLV